MPIAERRGPRSQPFPIVDFTPGTQSDPVPTGSSVLTLDHILPHLTNTVRHTGVYGGEIREFEEETNAGALLRAVEVRPDDVLAIVRRQLGYAVAEFQLQPGFRASEPNRLSAPPDIVDAIFLLECRARHRGPNIARAGDMRKLLGDLITRDRTAIKQIDGDTLLLSPETGRFGSPKKWSSQQGQDRAFYAQQLVLHRTGVFKLDPLRFADDPEFINLIVAMRLVNRLAEARSQGDLSHRRADALSEAYRGRHPHNAFVQHIANQRKDEASVVVPAVENFKPAQRAKKAEQPKTPERKPTGGVVYSVNVDSGTPKLMKGEPSDVPLSEVGGLVDVKRQLAELMVIIRNPDIAAQWAADAPTGIMFAGPPGTGKTFIAKALAHELGSNFVEFPIGKVIKKWINETAERMHMAFKLIGQLKGHTIVFIDEIDGHTRDRSAGGGLGLSMEVLEPLLNELDGFVGNSGVTFIAATNTPDRLDPALLRTGRFGEPVRFKLPKGDELIDLFGAIARRKERKAGRELFADIDVTRLPALLDGLSPADIAKGIVDEILRARAIQQAHSGVQPGPITLEDVIEYTRRFKSKREREKTPMGFRTT